MATKPRLQNLKQAPLGFTAVNPDESLELDIMLDFLMDCSIDAIVVMYKLESRVIVEQFLRSVILKHGYSAQSSL